MIFKIAIYLIGCIKIKKIKIKRVHISKKKNVSRRNFTVEYVVNVREAEIKKRKSEFLNVHDLHKYRRRFEIIVKKTQRSITPVKESAYRKILCSQYNIGFKLTQSDTSKDRDKIGIKIKAA